MQPTDPNQFVVKLRLAGEGHKSAAAELLPLVYDELRKLAAARLEGAGAQITLQPTALVHEAFIALVGKGDPGWNGKGHFFGAAARAMRNILVNRAREKGAQKRGGGRQRVTLDDAEGSHALAVDEMDFVSLDEALTDLEKESPVAAQVVMLRYFAGLSVKDTAEITQLSIHEVKMKWEFAKARLFSRLA